MPAFPQPPGIDRFRLPADPSTPLEGRTSLLGCESVTFPGFPSPHFWQNRNVAASCRSLETGRTALHILEGPLFYIGLSQVQTRLRSLSADVGRWKTSNTRSNGQDRPRLLWSNPSTSESIGFQPRLKYVHISAPKARVFRIFRIYVDPILFTILLPLLLHPNLRRGEAVMYLGCVGIGE
jgi:hypothetical protein